MEENGPGVYYYPVCRAGDVYSMLSVPNFNATKLVDIFDAVDASRKVLTAEEELRVLELQGWLFQEREDQAKVIGTDRRLGAQSRLQS